jgi:hypothetical protein
MQDEEVISYESHTKERDHEINSPTYGLELTMVVHILQMWRHYLVDCKFKVKTNHKSSCYIFTQSNLNTRMWHWIEF